jgi:hypothetical protein
VNDRMTVRESYARFSCHCRGQTSANDKQMNINVAVNNDRQ